ncbi:MAG TPA: potassium-transporting ATPase subunit C [Candidatus Angelobacter sp.]|nr:potassium-transporting ATPase subunit C [Candidatus Angelobacter sp.]
MSIKSEVKRNYGPALRLAVVSLLLCGLVFPLVVTGFAQILLHDQANGSLAHLNSSHGKTIGSYVVAQNFSKPFFFHSRNATLSASGADPDITLADALSQVPRISAATNITLTDLSNLVNQNIERTSFVFGDEYVNVLRVNLALIQTHQSTYQKLQPSLFA